MVEEVLTWSEFEVELLVNCVVRKDTVTVTIAILIASHPRSARESFVDVRDGTENTIERDFNFKNNSSRLCC